MDHMIRVAEEALPECRFSAWDLVRWCSYHGRFAPVQQVGRTRGWSPSPRALVYKTWTSGGDSFKFQRHWGSLTNFQARFFKSARSLNKWNVTNTSSSNRLSPSLPLLGSFTEQPSWSPPPHALTHKTWASGGNGLEGQAC